MKRSTESNVKCFNCEDVVLHNEELEGDIRKLQNMITATGNYFEEMHERYSDLPDFDLVACHLSRAIGNPEELLMVLPEE
jgi:hypothetical protein